MRQFTVFTASTEHDSKQLPQSLTHVLIGFFSLIINNFMELH